MIIGMKDMHNRGEVTSLVSGLPDMLDKVAFSGKPFCYDEVVKDFLHDAGFTGFLLSRVVKEIKGISIEKFCEYTGACEENAFKLKGEPTEQGTMDTKAVRLDFVLEYESASENLLRINIEPQATQEAFHGDNLKSYSLVARAVYYACLTMATELQTGEQYHTIHKVYSIWICYERPIPDMREPIISYSMKPDAEYQYCNGDNGTLEAPRRKFDNGDLVSVVLISMPDVENAVKEGKDGNNGITNKTLEELNYLLSNEVDMETRKYFMIENGIIRKGVDNMSDLFDLEQRLTKRMEIFVAKNTEQVTQQVTEQVTQQVTKQVTEQVKKEYIAISYNMLLEAGVPQDSAMQSLMRNYKMTAEQLQNILNH